MLLGLQARSNWPRRQEGQILVLFTLSIVVIMLFASIVIDLGLLRNNRQLLVNATDAASLAGATKMPVNGCINKTQPATSNCASVDNTEVNAVDTIIRRTIQASYPGIQAANYTISYRCLIGVDTQNPPQPYIGRDIPVVCNPRMALGHTPVAADFKGAGPTRYSNCRPDLGDKCNVVYISASLATRYSFGTVVGVNEGYTGSVVSAACNGPCGQPPAAPVDLIVIIDRSGSMDPDPPGGADDLTNVTKDAAKAILGVYNSGSQRVALGLLGPSKPAGTCSGAGGGPPVGVLVGTSFSLVPPPTTNTGNNWIRTASTPSAGAASLTVNKPSNTQVGDLLVASITASGGTATTVAGNAAGALPGDPSIGNPPVGTATPTGWTLIRRTDNLTNVSLLTYYRVATAADVAASSYTWTLTPNARASGGILLFTGVDTANPINISGDAISVVPSNLPTAPIVTTTSGQTALLAFNAIASGGSGSGHFSGWTNSTTERFDIRHANAAGPSLGYANKAVPAAGATGTTAATAASAHWASQHIALTPRVPDPYGTNPASDLPQWIPIGFTGSDTDIPAPAWNEPYSDAAGNPLPGSHLVSGINCHDSDGYTNLATPLAMARYYLENFGRPDSTWGVLFETDGQPVYNSTGAILDHTCGQAVINATALKGLTNAQGKHVELFTVGYGLNGSGNELCPDGRTIGGHSYPNPAGYLNKYVTKALSDMATGPDLPPIPPLNGSTADCVAAENADQDHFFCEPKTNDLTTVFKIIATQLAGIRPHLVQVDPLPVVSSISPTSGPPGGGTVVTLTGKYFTGINTAGCTTCGVKVNGVNGAFTFLNDTTVRVTTPAGPGGQDVHIIVSTPAGSSPASKADIYHYN